MTQTQTFEAGETYYDEHGLPVTMQGRSPRGGYIVTSDDGRESILPELFTESAEDRNRTEIERQEARLEQLEYEIRTAELRLHDLGEKHEAIRHIEGFLNDEYTHFVVADYRDYKVVTKLELTEWRRAWNLPLLVLNGRSQGDLIWRRSKRSRGGEDRWFDIRPCRGAEEAAQLQAHLYRQDVEHERKNGNSVGYVMARALEAGVALTVDEQREALAEQRRREQADLERCQNRIAEHQASAEKRLARLAELDTELQGLSNRSANRSEDAAENES